MLLLPTLSLGTLLLSLLKGLEINELFPPYWVWERERGGKKDGRGLSSMPLCWYSIYLERHEEEEEKEEDCPAASIPADAFETSAKKVDGKRERKKILSEIEMGTKVGQGRKKRRGAFPFSSPLTTLPLSSSYCVRSVDSPFLLYALFLATGQDNSSVILS